MAENSFVWQDAPNPFGTWSDPSGEGGEWVGGPAQTFVQGQTDPRLSYLGTNIGGQDYAYLNQFNTQHPIEAHRSASGQGDLDRVVGAGITPIQDDAGRWLAPVTPEFEKLYGYQEPSGFDKFLGMAMPGLIGAGMTAGIGTGLFGAGGPLSSFNPFGGSSFDPFNSSMNPFSGGGGGASAGGGALPGTFESAGWAGTGISGLDPAATLATTAAGGAAPVTSLTSPGFLPGTTSFAPGALSSGATAGMTSGGTMDQLLQLLRTSGMLPGGGGPLTNALNFGSGLYGMYQSNQTRKLAERAMQANDPFGPYRGQFAGELQALYADPSRIERLPGYQAGLTAVERKKAGQGYLGSGNMMAALAQYGGDFFDKEVQRLAMLSGAGFAPRGGDALLSGNTAANDLASRALATLGYGVRGMEGNTGGINGGRNPWIIWN